MTVSITNPKSKEPSPGDTDPAIAQTLADAVRNAWSHTSSSSPMRQLLGKRSSFYVSQSMRMRTGGNVPWWSSRANPQEENDMTYECDPKLGHPKEVDCAHVEWEELGADADVLELVPGTVRNLTSSRSADLTSPFKADRWYVETCNVAVGSAIAMTLSWAQIRTALDTLLNVCVRHPLLPARGGRAFYGKHPTQLSGKRRRDEDLTGRNGLPISNFEILTQVEPGLNALPSGVSLTVSS